MPPLELENSKNSDTDRNQNLLSNCFTNRLKNLLNGILNFYGTPNGKRDQEENTFISLLNREKSKKTELTQYLLMIYALLIGLANEK